MNASYAVNGVLFQSTPPMRGATMANAGIKADQADFNPRPPCGERQPGTLSGYREIYFNPRPPCGERLDTNTGNPIEVVFQSTPPMWGATSSLPATCQVLSISIHAPHVGSDRGLSAFSVMPFVFQSTPPMWGATQSSKDKDKSIEFQSTPPMWGATIQTWYGTVISDISIHAPHVGSDGCKNSPASCKIRFQSTPPMWGATYLWA